MPRAFTESERSAIRSTLLQTGRDCYERYGPSRTTIEDLVGPAGIARASFYLFFSSKEELFLEILLEEASAMVTRLIDASFGATLDPREALVLLMRHLITEIETNKLTRSLLDDPAALRHMAEGTDSQDVLRRSVILFEPLFREINSAQQRGEIIRADPIAVFSILGLVKTLPVHRSRVPVSLYRSLIALVPEVIADGLTHPTDPSRCAPMTDPSTRRDDRGDQ